MDIKKMTSKSLSLFAIMLLISSCSGHSHEVPDEAHPEDTAALEDAVVDPAAMAATDDAPKTEAPTADTPISNAPDSLTDQTNVSKTEAAVPTPIADSAPVPVTESPAETVDEPAPVHSHKKAHHKSKLRVAHHKAKAKKISEPEPTTLIANAAPEEMGAPQPGLTPAQQAQMAADAAAAAAPVATPGADMAITPAVAPPVEPVAAQTPNAPPVVAPEPKTNTFLTYGGVGAVVLLGGYFFYRRRKS